MHVNANDGIGFYLLQLAKCLLRHPETKVDLAGIKQAIQWLAMHTHWNGLLDDHSEPVTMLHAERLVGSPYSQGLCMAGLRAIGKALRLIGEHDLADNAEWLFRLQIKGFRWLYDEVGFIRDIQNLEGPDGLLHPERGQYISSYSMPCPSLVLLDPEVDVHDLDHLYPQTMQEVKDGAMSPGNPWMFGRFNCGGGSYGHCGMIGSLLNLCRLAEAGGFINEVLKYSEDTRLRYVLSEGITYKDESYRERYERLRAYAPWTYKDLDEKDPSLFGSASNPGCLVMPSYWLYCVDLITGIAIIDQALRIWPKIPGFMTNFRVSNYHTPRGSVSYELVKETGRMKFRLQKPEVEALVLLGPLAEISRVTVDGKAASFQKVQAGDGIFAQIQLKETQTNSVLEVC